MTNRWVLGLFAREGALLEAARALRAAGLTSLDLHSPYPIHGAEDALGLPRSTVPVVALVAGVTGAATGYLLQWGTVGYLWPLNVGGRPPQSAPAFIPVTFELAVLFLVLLFLRYVPAIPIFEVKELKRELEHRAPALHGDARAEVRP